jgi:hypothetical protein
MWMQILRPLLLLVVLACGLPGPPSAAAASPRLYIDWPADWEYQEPIVRDSITYLRARQSREGSIVQQLRMEVTPAARTGRSVDSQSLRELTVRLRDEASAGQASVPDVSAFSTMGYYFVTERETGVDARYEGVLMRNGHFLHFTLSTKEADPSEMLAALGSVRIQ